MTSADTFIIGVCEHGVLPAVAAGPDPVVSDLLKLLKLLSSRSFDLLHMAIVAAIMTAADTLLRGLRSDGFFFS